MIKATIIAHSKSAVNGKEIVTFELEYPRFIHSELMTHRLFSRNAASSRAIPVAKMIAMVRENPAMPVHWGKNQPGMQAKEECDVKVFVERMFEYHLAQTGDIEQAIALCMHTREYAWFLAADCMATYAEEFESAGYHKQIVNRILEPFQWMKTVVTATEFDNWFWLRNHPDAQPEIKELAEKMWEALKASKPVNLQPGEWHVPYVAVCIFDNVVRPVFYSATGNLEVIDDASGEVRKGTFISWKDALAISSSCCAQVSYRKLDDSLEKAQDIYKRLVESEPVHASPFEHQATPMKPTYSGCMERPWFNPVNTENPAYWEKGITHADRDGKLWSGNFCGFVQHRQLIPNNACWNYKEQE